MRWLLIVMRLIRPSWRRPEAPEELPETYCRARTLKVGLDSRVDALERERNLIRRRNSSEGPPAS